MKANELMIGDWVLLWDKPQRVNYINLDDGERIGTDKQYLAQIVEAFKPIPLTKEILEKNGFVVEPEYCYDAPLQYCEIIDGLWISISGETYFEGKLEYIHELQHALRLCRIDKEIVIWN